MNGMDVCRLVRLVVPLILALGAGTGTAARQRATFSTSTEAVRVDVLVTRDGRAVLGLGPQDFEVSDNGVRQELDIVDFEQLPLNVVIALDVSGSVAFRFDHLRTGTTLLLAQLTPLDRVGLLLFGDSVLLGSPLTRDVGAVRRALEGIEPAGQTVLVDATYAGITLGEGGEERTLLIVFTDGVDSSSFLTREAVLEIAKRTDVVAYAVTVGATGERGFLRALVRQTAGDLIEVKSAADVSRTFVRILQEFRQRYVLSYSLRGVESDGWHEIQVRVKRRGVSVKARPGYLRSALR